MVLNDEKFFERMTYNAEGWADHFLEEGVQRDQADRYAETLRRTQRAILSIISVSIKLAISGHTEYSRYNWMETNLITAFNNPDIIRIDPVTGILDLFVGAEENAGDWEDFWSGYEAALAEIAPNAFRASPEKRAQIWQDIIWPDDYKYSKTLAIRRNAWGDKAPWWNWLEVGNKGLDGAFPQNPATSFLFLAQDEARILFNETLESVENEEFNVVEQAWTRFMNDPEGYKPFDILDEFYAEGKRYMVYITATRRLGVTQRIRR
jgi:hypothetical protein